MRGFLHSDHVPLVRSVQEVCVRTQTHMKAAGQDNLCAALQLFELQHLARNSKSESPIKCFQKSFEMNYISNMSLEEL
jgi:hypothetical protein